MGRKRYVISAALFLVMSLAATAGAETVHVLREGETLYGLGRRYGVSVDELLAANGISDPSGLGIGSRIVIPGEEGTAAAPPTTVAETYTVARGDTYYGIARRHGISVDELMALNGRDASRVLKVGERLVVSSGAPGRVPPPAVRVVVSAGPVRVSGAPEWPVAGLKAPLSGKLVGVSIEADAGSYVHAVASGDVVWTGPYRGFGDVVLVDSGGYIYLYGGNEDLFVNVGQTVAAGSRIGRLGTAGPDGSSRDMIFSVFREGVPVSPDDAPRG